MRHIGITGMILGTALTLAMGCSSRVSQGDSETHWLVCRTTADCHGGQTCESDRCVDAIAPGGDGGGLPRITNPTGTCVAPDAGGRRGYHTPDAGDVWLPDCANTLKREYFRVFAKSATSAYVMPRPDSARELVIPCNTDTHPLRALVNKYSFCTSPTDTATVDRMNDMLPAEALTLTHYMHTQLLFEAAEGIPTVAIQSYPLPSDVLDACALHPGALSPELTQDCEAQRNAIDEGPTFYTTATELAKLLNELYGIGGTCPPNEFAARVCTQCGPSGGCGQTEIRCTRGCAANADCLNSSAGARCRLSVCGPDFGPCL